MKWLSVDEWQRRHSSDLQTEFPGILFYFVDGTVVEVEESGDMAFRRMLWNNKHQIHSFSFFIVVAPDGRIAYVSSVDNGNMHDKTAWEQSGVVQELEEMYTPADTNFELAIGGDKAYPHMTVPKGWHKYITKSGEVPGEKSDPVLHFTPQIAKHRAVVERTIGKIKEWHILTRKQYLVHDKHRVAKIVFIIANLVNQSLYSEFPDE